MGIEHWLELLISGEEEARNEILEFCSRFAECHAAALRRAGADVIAYADPVASATFLTVEKFRELALPWISRIIATIGPAGIIFFNGGGRINPILKDVQSSTGIRVYYLNPFDDVTEARGSLGPQSIIAGCINDIRLLDWSPDQTEQEVARLVRTGKAQGAFIFGTLLVPMRVPESNIRAMVNAAIEHGTYPVAM